ncbi:MAG: sigma-70 family RNA polymerase sigma factor [Polyangiaceae bacterium]
MDRATERELAERWAAGDEEAGKRLVEGCLPFVTQIAFEYRRWGIPQEDIIQQGNVGLLRAAKKFDPSRDCRLATYAAYWIRAEIREYVVRGYRVVRLGTTKGERRALRAYRTTRESDPVRLAEISGLPEERVRVLLPLLAARETSLDAATPDKPSAADRIVGNDPTPEERFAESEEGARAKAAIDDALLELSDRERLIVRERMMNDDPSTLQELGEVLGVSKERVRQLEERVKDKLGRKLGSFRDLAIAV